MHAYTHKRMLKNHPPPKKKLLFFFIGWQVKELEKGFTKYVELQEAYGRIICFIAQDHSLLVNLRILCVFVYTFSHKHFAVELWLVRLLLL